MKLLFDQNLSHRLLTELTSRFPQSSHVRLCGLESAADEAVWTFARDNNFTIVSKDSDFLQHSLLRGVPPKLIWLRLGNCSTGDVKRVLTRFESEIRAFDRDRVQAVLVIP